MPANGSQGLCWAHDPANHEKRRTNASRAAKAKPSKEVANLKAEVREVISEVKDGELERTDAAVMLQGYRVLKDLVELERRVKTTEELAAELQELKERFELGQRRTY